ALRGNLLAHPLASMVPRRRSAMAPAPARTSRLCGSPLHDIGRRQFLQGGVATALGVSLGGLGAAYSPAWADELRRTHKRVLLLWLAGGASQLETFDPKPGRPTGGPFKAIATA